MIIVVSKSEQKLFPIDGFSLVKLFLERRNEYAINNFDQISIIFKNEVKIDPKFTLSSGLTFSS